jgi:hypothetical protein
MKPEEWKRAQALVDDALKRDTEERDAFLDHARASRPSPRAAVASLLTAHNDPGVTSGNRAGDSRVDQIIGP